jgi:hypothetical protein
MMEPPVFYLESTVAAAAWEVAIIFGPPVTFVNPMSSTQLSNSARLIASLVILLQEDLQLVPPPESGYP